MCGWRSGEVDVGEVGRGDTVELTTSIEIPQMAAVRVWRWLGGALAALNKEREAWRRTFLPLASWLVFNSKCWSDTAGWCI